MNHQAIIDRANELSASMPIGAAIWTAIRETNVPETEIGPLASVIAAEIVNDEINLVVAETDILRISSGAWANLHREAQELVKAWAISMKRTGAAHKQARQGRIRKLVKHGLDSRYADGLRKEIANVLPIAPSGDRASCATVA